MTVLARGPSTSATIFAATASMMCFAFVMVPIVNVGDAAFAVSEVSGLKI